MSTTELLHLANSIRDPDTKQEALLGLLQAGDDLDLSEAQAICRRARFRAAWAARQERKRSVSLELVGEPEPGPSPVRPGATSAAFRLLALLPEHQRQAYLLHHVSGYSVTETAKLLGVDRRTVGRWLKSARKKFDAHVALEELSALGK